MILTLLIVLLLLALLGVFPRWPYSQSWGYSPFGLILIVLILVLLIGR